MANVTVQPGDFCCLPSSGHGGALTHLGEKLNGRAFAEYQDVRIYVGDLAQKTLMRDEVMPPLRMTYGWMASAHPDSVRFTELAHPASSMRSVLWSSGAVPLTNEQRNAIVAAVMNYLIVKHGALDYFAFAAHRFGANNPALKRRIASAHRMISSTLVDRCYADAGVHLFNDASRWPGYVTPADLAGLIHNHKNGSI